MRFNLSKENSTITDLKGMEVIGGVLCGLGLYLLYIVIHAIYSSLHIRNYGVLTTATIKSKYLNKIYYEFVDAENNKIDGSDTLEIHKQMTKYQSGKKVSIKYDPLNPKNNQLFDIENCSDLEANTRLKQEKDMTMMFIWGTITAIIFGPIFNAIMFSDETRNAIQNTLIISCVLSFPFCLLHALINGTIISWFGSKDKYKLEQKRTMTHHSLPYSKNEKDPNYKALS